MDFKTYKLNKLNYLLKTNNLVHICYIKNINSKNWNKLEQNFIKNDLKYYKISNTILVNLLKNSIFKNIILLINGPIIIVFSNKLVTNLNYKTFLNLLTPNIKLLCTILNNKIYSKKQLESISLNYKNNIIIFNKLLNNLNKLAIYKLKKI